MQNTHPYRVQLSQQPEAEPVGALDSMLSALGASAQRVLRASGPASQLGGCRWTSALIRRRRRALFRAMEDPSVNPAKVQKLRERAAKPTHSLLRYLWENRIGKVQTQEDRKKLWYEHRYIRYAPSFIGQIKPKMRLWTAALEESQLPLARLPEVAVCGRSNSGKSTLLNYLCGQESANVRRFPGSTTELVFWKVGRPAQLCLVDLPGYGYAEASEEKRLQWTEFMLWYVRARKNLKRLLLLIDVRQGLKPADREMIAYLERHSVPWQIIVTKCDKVPGKEIARRLTIMKDELSQYRRMAGDPVPVSALKRRGMDPLRDILNQMKVAKEMVKEGIRLKVYDLLEQRRIRNREKRRRKGEKKAAAAAAAAEAAQAKAKAEAEEAENPEDAAETDLHQLLGNWAHATRSEEPQQKPGPSVSKAFFTTDDRDSRRVDSFMSSLFPDLSELRAMGSTASTHTVLFPQVSTGGAASGIVGSMSHEHGSFEVGVSDQSAQSDAFAYQPSDEESGDEEDPEIKPEVRRFDFQYTSDTPAARHAEGPSPFPGFKMPERERRSSEVLQVGLRHAHSTQRGDKLYTEDDFASPQDYAAGFKRWAPSAPSGKPGKLMAEIRQRYEREWSMELEDVSQNRKAAPDTERSDARPGKLETTPVPAQAPRKMPFVTQKGLKPIPKGHEKKRIFGAPPAKILKMKRTPDAARALGLKTRDRRRKRNTGTGLDWEQAKEKWLSWYSQNQRNWDRISQADSPKKEDVEAAYEMQQERRRQRLSNRQARHRGGRARDANAQRDEAALPEWAAGRDE